MKLHLDSFVLLAIAAALSLTHAAIAQNGAAPARSTVRPENGQNELKACSQSDFVKYGPPVMFRRRDGVAYGVSTEKNRYTSKEQVRAYIWLSNQSTSDVVTSSCCELTFLRYIQVLDAAGRRLASVREDSNRKLPVEESVLASVCSCSGPVMPNHPGFCGVIDFGTLNRPDTAYNLPPGEYTVFEQEKKSTSQPNQRTDTPAKNAGLAITIEP
jgi:hypothetical protein